MLVVLLWEVASGSDATSDHKGTSKIELFGGCCSTNVKSSWNRQKNSSNLNQHGGEAKAKTSGWQGFKYRLFLLYLVSTTEETLLRTSSMKRTLARQQSLALKELNLCKQRNNFITRGTSINCNRIS